MRSALSGTARVAMWAAIGVIALSCVLFAVWFGPIVLTHSPGASIGTVRRLQLMNDVRNSLLTALAGVGALVGLAYTGRTYRLSRAGQITDRFTRAVDHLASPNVDVRTAAVYALERIMNDSHFDRRPIIELLASFIRGHATGDDLSRNPAPGQVERPFKEAYAQLFDIPYLSVRAVDVQAALTILGRTRKPAGTGPVYLGSTNLIRANLRGARFTGNNMAEAHLEIAQLSAADLRQASLFRAQLVGAYLFGADLRGAELDEADLRLADLSGADLRGATLARSDLRQANLDGARLRAALADTQTRWPAGFDPVGAGVQVASQAVPDSSEIPTPTGDAR